MNFKAPNFVLGKTYEVYVPAAKAADVAGFYFKDTEDYRFTVTEVERQDDMLLVWTKDVYWTDVKGITTPPPPTHPKLGVPILPALLQYCRLVSE